MDSHFRMSDGNFSLLKASIQIEHNGPQRDKQKLFLSKVAWFSIEIDIHVLTSIVLLVMEGILPEHAINIHLFSSQNCEATFRNARALTGTFSSITNFTVQQFMQKTEKLSILNNIKTNEESNDSPYALKFPVHHKNTCHFSNTTASNRNIMFNSINDIEQIIIKAYHSAEKILGNSQIESVLQEHQLNDINKLGLFIFDYLHRTSKTNDHSSFDNPVVMNDSSDSETSEDGTIEEQDTSDEDILDALGSSEELNGASGNGIDEIKTIKNQFYGVRIYDDVNSSHVQHYFKINVNNQQKFLHKQTAAYILTKDKNHLSSDRLSRVQQMNRHV